MEHTNPTLLAQVLASDPPRPHPAGLGSENKASTQRLQLARDVRLGMEAEIKIFRDYFVLFNQSVLSGEDNDDLAKTAKALDLLGLSCSRLANILRINVRAGGNEVDELREYSEEALRALLQEYDQARREEHE